MGVVINRTFPDLGQWARRDLVTREMMRDLGLLARERIVRRTISGRDQSGAPFEPYSRAYAERKAEELGGGTVNLQVSGAMLNDLQIVDVTDRSVTLGWVT